MTGLRKVRLYSKLFYKKSKKYWNCSFGKFIFFDKLHSTETQGISTFITFFHQSHKDIPNKLAYCTYNR